MKKRITMLLAAIGVLLVIMLPAYADVISETSVPVESEVVESESLPETDIETETERYIYGLPLRKHSFQQAFFL